MRFGDRQEWEHGQGRDRRNPDGSGSHNEYRDRHGSDLSCNPRKFFLGDREGGSQASARFLNRQRQLVSPLGEDQRARSYKGSINTPSKPLLKAFKVAEQY